MTIWWRDGHVAKVLVLQTRERVQNPDPRTHRTAGWTCGPLVSPALDGGGMVDAQASWPARVDLSASSEFG